MGREDRGERREGSVDLFRQRSRRIRNQERADTLSPTARARPRGFITVSKKIAIAGGGAAGFFAAIACARANPANEVSIYERGSEFLTKVRISGGGRCNVTHACFDARTMSAGYPRGERALIVRASK